MICKNFRNRHKKGNLFHYCILKRKEVCYEDCNHCNYKEYKTYKSLKSHSNRLNKREKERYSIIYHDLSKCCECGLKNGDFDSRINMYTRIEKNEVFSGSYRQQSMIDGMVAPMCLYCHKRFHNDIDFNLEYKVLFEKEYLKNHSLDDFISKYGKDYIYKLEQKKRSRDS